MVTSSLFREKKPPTIGHVTNFWLMRFKYGLGWESLWKTFSFLITREKTARRGIIFFLLLIVSCETMMLEGGKKDIVYFTQSGKHVEFIIPGGCIA